MSAVEVTISGVLYDRVNRTQQSVVLIGEAMLTGLGPGGGPIIPPPGGEKPPGFWGPPGPWPTPPIHLPEPGPLPPNVILPPPGSPPVIVPGTTPTQPITPPQAIVVDYPGIGKVVVPQPLPHDVPQPKR